jgi:carboxyl-terminal processing protease
MNKIIKFLIYYIIISPLFGYYGIIAAFEINSTEESCAAFLERVYNVMDENYYKPVSRKKYKDFQQKYTVKVLEAIKEKSGMDHTIAQFAAGLLVNELKDPDDNFTNFIPPKEAVEFTKTVYGYENGIGIDGQRHEDVYLIEKVELRSNAYKAGIAKGDLLIEIENNKISELTDEQIKNLIYPPIDTSIKIKVLHKATQVTGIYTITCTEFFEETILPVPTGIQGIHYLKISKFNRMTGEDLKEYLRHNNCSNIDHLVLDITDNPGGPPLAVHEISGIFLPPRQNLFYYKKKNVDEFGLRSPESDVVYKNRLIIVINNKSGSASELFAGTMKAYRRAVILGKSSTAGLAELKGAFDFDDGSVLAMITGQAFIFNGTLIDKNGINPDYIIPEHIEDIQDFVLKQIQISS